MVIGVPPAVLPELGVIEVACSAAAVGKMHWLTLLWINGCNSSTLAGWNTDEPLQPLRPWQ